MWCKVWAHQRAFVSLTKGKATGLQIIQVRDCRPRPNRVQSLIPCHTPEPLFPWQKDSPQDYRSYKSGTADQHLIQVIEYSPFYPVTQQTAFVSLTNGQYTYISIYASQGRQTNTQQTYSHDRRTWLQFKIPCQCHTVESLCFSGNVLNIIQVEHCRLTPNRVQSLVPCHTPDSFCSPDKVRSAKISDCIRHFSNQCGILSAKTGSQNQSDNHCNWSEDTRPSILVTRLLELY